MSTEYKRVYQIIFPVTKKEEIMKYITANLGLENKVSKNNGLQDNILAGS